jgi:GGDEF domain-containing protein
MDGAGHFGRRPRPVADAPAVDAAVVAKAWLLALVADAPLAQAGSVPAAELARGGPALCSGVLVALGSDAELERLVVGDGRAPLGASAARLTGARTPAALAAGIEALRAATWRALRAELRDPLPELVADLSDRLAYVCARVTEASLAAPGAEAPGRSGPLSDALSSSLIAPAPPPEEGAAPRAAAEGIRAYVPLPQRRAGEEGRAGDAQREDPAAAPSHEGGRSDDAHREDSTTAPAHAAGARTVDPLLETAASAAAPPHDAPVQRDEPLAPPPAGVQVVDLPPAPAHVDPLTSLAEELAAAPPTGVAGAPDDAAMYAPARDAPTVTRLRKVDASWEAAHEAGPPWLAAIARRLERREQDGLPFAVFVVEVDDLDRLLASQTGREVALALETAERGLTAELAPADLVVRERLGRWWLTSPDRDPGAARDLGTRVATAIARAQLGGAPLAASVGVAVCPDDGESLDALAGRADEGMFAARAAGVPLA